MTDYCSGPACPPDPTPSGSGNRYVDEGGKECNDKPYFISVCEGDFVDPVMRHTIVEAAATLHNCQVCITCEEVANAIAALNALMEQASSSYGCSKYTEQTDSGTTTYQDVTGWQEDGANADFSLSGGSTVTCNKAGSCSVKGVLSISTSSGTSSCSTRIVRTGGTDVETGTGTLEFIYTTSPGCVACKLTDPVVAQLGAAFPNATVFVTENSVPLGSETVPKLDVTINGTTQLSWTGANNITLANITSQVNPYLTPSGGTFYPIPGTELTSATSTTPTNFVMETTIQVEVGDQIKLQYKNNDSDISHTVDDYNSDWDLTLIPSNIIS